MYKVLIIDDEEPLREAINILGDWDNLGVDQVLEATDGKVGLAMLRANKIDLALVDMKMPELNGNELLQVIESEFPDLLTIVISGFNDFQYTRQAIRSKVVDYLLKPVNRTDLNTALRKALDILEDKRKKQSEFISRNITLNMSLPKLKEKMYLSIIEYNFKNQSNEAFLPLIGAGVAGNYFAAAVLRLLNLEQIRQNRFQEDRDLLHFAVTNVLNDENNNANFQAFSFASPKEEREFIVIFTMTGGYSEDAAFLANHHMKKVVSLLKELFGITSVAGMGQPYVDVMDIAKSFEFAKASIDGMDLLNLKEGTVVTRSSHNKSLGKESSSLTGRMPHIRNALENGNIHQAKSILSEFINKKRALSCFSLGEADRTIQEFSILLNDVTNELDVGMDRLSIGKGNGLRELGVQGDFASFEQFEMVLNHILESYATRINKSHTGDRSSLMLSIKEYVDDHYYENIKISMFTDKYFLSREYLMKLFKVQFGYGIHEYVQKVRMDKARELLSDANLKIQDISETLGYKDKNYFSKAFRNYYDCSPTEYRFQLLEKQN